MSDEKHEYRLALSKRQFDSVVNVLNHEASYSHNECIGTGCTIVEDLDNVVKQLEEQRR